MAGGSWPGGQPPPPSSQPIAPTASAESIGGTMSKLTRALVLGATLVAMNLVGMTAVAQAQTNNEPASKQDAQRPPTERQVGETWRHGQVAAPQADRRGRRLAAGTGPRALLHPQRDTRPGARPSAYRIERTARLAPRLARCPGCSRARGRAGRAGRQASRPQSSGPARGLTTVTVAPLDGAAAPTRQPHHPCRRRIAGIRFSAGHRHRVCALVQAGL
jgi:hypothetical protein